MALILSPHPDDECVIGGLALRLMRESGVRIVSVAMTLGSNRERQAERLDELRGLRLDRIRAPGNHPGRVRTGHPESREKDPDHWKKSVGRLVEIIDQWALGPSSFPMSRIGTVPMSACIFSPWTLCVNDRN